MTLLEIVRQITAELGLAYPSGVVGNQDSTVRQIYALMGRLGQDMTRDFNWQSLVREYILITNAVTKSATTTAGSPIVTMADTTGLSKNWGVSGAGARPFSQVLSVDSATQVTLNMPAEKSMTADTQFSQIQYPLPSDWKKQIPQTEWDRTNRWPLMGPQSSQDWQSFKSGVVYAGPQERFRILASAITLNPPPPNGLLLAFEYVSKNWVLSASGVGKPSLTSDDDTTIYDDSLMVLGTKVLFLQAKGLDFSLEAQQFQNLLDKCKAQDASAAMLSIAPRPSNRFLSNRNVPDGSWGAPQW